MLVYLWKVARVYRYYPYSALMGASTMKGKRGRYSRARNSCSDGFFRLMHFYM